MTNDENFCPNCGEHIEEKAKFCSACGKKLMIDSNESKKEAIKNEPKKAVHTRNKEQEKPGSTVATRAFPKWVGILGALFVVGISVYFIMTKRDVASENLEVETPSSQQNESAAEDDAEVSIADFVGYWHNDNGHSFFLNEDAFFITDAVTLSMNSFDYEVEEVRDNSITLALKELREEGSEEILIPNEELIVELNAKDSEIYLSGEAVQPIQAVTFYPKRESEMSGNFARFIEADDADGAKNYQGPDLTMEDFTGYWAPFDKYHASDDVRSPFGSYIVYLDEDYFLTGMIDSYIDADYIRDYSIEGNTIDLEREYLTQDLHFFEEGHIDFVERDIMTMKATLFKEENDRDRLILHMGNVLQRVSEEELRAANLSLFADKYNRAEDSSIQVLQSLTTDQYSITERSLNDDSVKVQNYPYSVGDLSHAQLYEEKQIIEGTLAHPETSLSNEEAVRQLLNGTFESTPSVDYIHHVDTGYYFDSSGSESASLGSVTIGFGGRTYWASGPQYFDIARVTFDDHIYTVEYVNPYSEESGEVQRFYRIDENIIYTEDENGEFTIRFEQGTDWNDFHGLPNRSFNE